MTIDGGGRIVLKAGNNERHFFAGMGVTFRLQNIILRDGNSLVSGGAVEASGADVILSNVQLLDNAAAVTGGAIYCFDGTLTIANSLLQNNAAKTSGGAIYNVFTTSCAAKKVVTDFLLHCRNLGKCLLQ